MRNYSFIPLKAEDILEPFTAVYASQVEKRGGTYIPDEMTSANIHAVVKWLTDPERKPGLILYGNQPGTGKTTMAHTIAQVLYKDAYSWIRDAFDERFQEIEYKRYADEFRDQREEIGKEADALDKEFRAKMAVIKEPTFITALYLANLAKKENADLSNLANKTSTPFLLIDDIGTEPIEVRCYGNRILPFVDLFSLRYNLMLPTVITTNLGDRGISDYYGPRIADRITELCDKIAFNGSSFRK